MEKQQVFVYQEYERPEELDPLDRELLTAAREALKSSYSPYSNYKVGAAVRLKDGSIFHGSNQENMAFPSSLCAERVACFSASAAKPGIPVAAVAITAKSAGFSVDRPVTPCGGCRQVLMEYEKLYNQKIRVIMMGETGSVLVVESIDQLLPFSFDERKLQKNNS